MPIVIKIKEDSLCNGCLNVMDVTEKSYEGNYNYKMNGKYFERKFFCIKSGKEINYATIVKCNMHRPRKKKKKEMQNNAAAL